MWPPKGKFRYWWYRAKSSLTVFNSFGWVNASYCYALQIVNAHMKRALGAVTTWDTFKKMTEGADDPVDVLTKQATHTAASTQPDHHPGPVQYAETHHSGAGNSHNHVNSGTKA